MIQNREDFCLHPRTIVPAHLNGDDQPDIFVTCHGFDRPPYPGEQNRVLLSQSDGSYLISTPTTDIGFFHGGTAADFDGDGDTDILATDNKLQRQLWLFQNDGSGNFKKSNFRQPKPLDRKWPSLVTKVLDVNGDGLLDLFAAGHEWENMPSYVFLNDGSFDFRRARTVRLPAVDGHGVVLDAVATGSPGDRSLWLMRTSGGGGSFYKGRTIQRIRLQTLESEIAMQSLKMPWSPYIKSWTKDGVIYIGDDIGGLNMQVSK